MIGSGYWNGVGKRISSIGKTVLDSAGTLAVDYAVTRAVEKTCSVIESKLKKMYVRTGINSAISFMINLAGILILVFRPFGEAVSRYVASGFFFLAFVNWLVRTVLFIRKNGVCLFRVSRCVVEERSVYSGIEKYVLQNFPVIAFSYAGVSIASEYVSSLKRIPGISELARYLAGVFWKQIALFSGIMAGYTVVFFWIVKPMLIRQYF